jgi:hypothetical protein
MPIKGLEGHFEAFFKKSFKMSMLQAEGSLTDHRCVALRSSQRFVETFLKICC